MKESYDNWHYLEESREKTFQFLKDYYLFPSNKGVIDKYDKNFYQSEESEHSDELIKTTVGLYEEKHYA